MGVGFGKSIVCPAAASQREANTKPNYIEGEGGRERAGGSTNCPEKTLGRLASLACSFKRLKLAILTSTLH